MPADMSPTVLRLLDANANRAREGLRVLEDYARFVLDDGALSGDLKQLRHELTAATRDVLIEAIVHRDTPGDVGVNQKTASELQRADLADVVIAAGKRLGEALRSIEEYLKTVEPRLARLVELARYRFYELEYRIHATLGRPVLGFSRVRLYVLITERYCRRPWADAAESALEGGADCLQLREKEMESRELLRRARILVDLCERHDALLIINDRPDIALLSGAAGVHVGQGDLPPREARKIVGAQRIVGVSTHDMEQARQAQADGADYIGVGPCFPSPTKPREFCVGPAIAGEISRSINIPVVGIAGITLQNLPTLLHAGMSRIAVTAAVVDQVDIAGAARSLKQQLCSGISPTALSAESK